MGSRNDNRSSPNPNGVNAMNTNLYSYNLGGNAYAPLPRGTKTQSRVSNLANTTPDDLSQALAGFNIGSYNVNNGGRGGIPGMAPGLIHMPVSGGQAPGQFYYTLGNRLVSVSGASAPESHQQRNNGPGMMAQGHFMQPAGYQPGQTVTNGSHGLVWTGVAQNSNELPDLAAPRRNSFSSNEETGPHTPFFGAQAGVDFQPRIQSTDNSPQAWNTPSPQQLGQGFYAGPTKNNNYMLCDLDALCQQDPAIPRPIPAIFSGDKGRGTLESSLMNKLNTTNVYIRGLHPDTSDEMLWAYGARFGTIDSAKSMMDQQTGTCKGYGLA